MDALYTHLTNDLATYGLNSTLAGIIFLVARAKYRDMMQENKKQCERLTRIEKSLLKAGVELLPLEEENHAF